MSTLEFTSICFPLIRLPDLVTQLEVTQRYCFAEGKTPTCAVGKLVLLTGTVPFLSITVKLCSDTSLFWSINIGKKHIFCLFSSAIDDFQFPDQVFGPAACHLQSGIFWRHSGCKCRRYWAKSVLEVLHDSEVLLQIIHLILSNNTGDTPRSWSNT